MRRDDDPELSRESLKGAAVASERTGVPGSCEAARRREAALENDQLPTGTRKRFGRTGEQADVDVLEVRAHGEVLTLCAQRRQQMLDPHLQLASGRHAEAETETLLCRAGVKNSHQGATLGDEGQRPAAAAPSPSSRSSTGLLRRWHL